MRERIIRNIGLGWSVTGFDWLGVAGQACGRAGPCRLLGCPAARGCVGIAVALAKRAHGGGQPGASQQAIGDVLLLTGSA
jgi:hypothetical protein